MKTSAKVLLKSCNPDGDILATFQIVAPQVIHPQFLRHRLQSLSILSMRAISPDKQILDELYIPEQNSVRYEERGMVGNTVLCDADYKKYVDWYSNLHTMIKEQIFDCPVDVHSQTINRHLVPQRFFRCIMTTTDFGLQNFFTLRKESDAQPDITELSNLMESAYKKAEIQELNWGEWHIPFIKSTEYNLETLLKLQVSSCRAARTSYGLYDDSAPFAIEKEVKFTNKLISDKHWSPLEHPAMAMPMLQVRRWGTSYKTYKDIYRNFDGFMQYRSFAENNLMPNMRVEDIYKTIEQKWTNYLINK